MPIPRRLGAVVIMIPIKVLEHPRALSFSGRMLGTIESIRT
jgi:hypothetical protein